MANYYYSGQGSLLIAERDEGTGKPKGFLPVGNVPELTINIETSKLEHKESETGSRLTDLTIITEKKGTFEFKLENLSLDNLAMGLWGETAVVAGGTVVAGTPETIAIDKFVVGKRYAMAHPKVSAVVVKDNANTVTYTVGTDYTVDLANGTITIVAAGLLAVATASAGVNIKVSYTYAGYTKVDAFTQANPPTRWLRFEGINTVDNTRVVIDIFKAQFDPLTGYGLINTELGSVAMKGAVLADLLQLTGSKFFSQKNVP
jgi:hypothetical protein